MTFFRSPLRSVKTLWRGTRGYLFGRHGERRVAGWQLLYNLRIRLILKTSESLRRFVHTRSVRLWADRRGFKRVEKLLRRAQHSIIIEMFIWKDDEAGRRVAGILLQCADRGVTVRIAKEVVGDVFEVGGDFLGTKEEKSGVWHRFWHHPNITATHTAYLNHAKTFIIDNHILLLTGMNIADEYREEWHDYVVELRGSDFIRHYLTLDGGNVGPVRLLTNTKNRKTMRRHVMELLTSARVSIVLEQAYLSDQEILSTLITSSKRGIELLIILPSNPDVHYHANMLSVKRLMNEGEKSKLRVFLYPGMVHGKIILVDQKRAFIGSTNLVRSSLDELGEAAVLLDGGPKRTLRTLRRILLTDTLRSRSLTDPPWFPIIRRLLAWLSL